jgi:DNA-binding NarL/FixJ family response regulator
MPTTRVLVVEDHPLFRKGVLALLDTVADLEVVGSAASGEEAVTRTADLKSLA